MRAFLRFLSYCRHDLDVRPDLKLALQLAGFSGVLTVVAGIFAMMGFTRDSRYLLGAAWLLIIPYCIVMYPHFKRRRKK